MNESTVIEGFTDMFEWNCIWKAKRQADNIYVISEDSQINRRLQSWQSSGSLSAGHRM
jgi:hypothetical protein